MAFAMTSTPAQADGWLDVHWTTDPGCVDAGALPGLAESVLGGAAESAQLDLDATLEPDGEWSVGLTLHPGVAPVISRTLRSRDCATLTRAVALVVAVQLDPVAAASRLGPEAPTVEAQPVVAPPVVVPETTAPEVVDSPPPPVVSQTDAPARRRRVPPQLRVGAGVAAEFGVLPRAAAAFEVSAGPLWQRARLDVAAVGSLGPDLRLANGVSARFRNVTGVVRGCGLLTRTRFGVAGCAGLEAGRFFGRSAGLVRAGAAAGLWIAATAGARPWWSVRPRFALGLLADLVIPIIRHQFTLDSSGVVYRVPAAGARLGVTAAFRLW